MKKETKQILEFSFLGSNEIEIINLADSLKMITYLCSRINYLSFPSSKTNITIQSTSQGSFKIDALVVLTLSPSLFNYITTLAYRYIDDNKISCYFLEQLDEMIGIKLFSKDKPFKKIKKINSENKTHYEVHNHIGEVKIFNSSPVIEDYFTVNDLDKSLSVLFQNAAERDGLKLDTKEGKRISLSKSECSEMVNNIMAKNSETNEITESVEANLYIKKPDLTGNANWEVLYHGSVIKVKVSDNNFLERVKGGYKVGSKDPIKALMNVTYKVDLDGRESNMSPKYEVVKVIE